MFQTHTFCGFAHEHSESRYQSAAAWGGECKAEERLQNLTTKAANVCRMFQYIWT